MIGRFNRKYVIILGIVWIAVIIAIFWFSYTFPTWYSDMNRTTTETVITPEVPIDVDESVITLPTIGNEFVYKTKSKTTIRNINEYDKTMFEGKKTVIFFFGTWCHSCEEEFQQLEQIINYYKKSNINIVIVSHDYEIELLIDFLESGEVNYDTEVYLDLNRIIRKTLDPSASTIPMSYVIDPNLNIINKYEGPVTLEMVQEWTKNFFEIQ